MQHRSSPLAYWPLRCGPHSPRRGRVLRPSAPPAPRHLATAALLEAVGLLGSIARPDVGEHETRVANVALMIAEELRSDALIGEEVVEAVGRYAGLHDIGELGVPAASGAQRGEREAAARGHVRIGVALVEELRRIVGESALPGFAHLRAIVAQHHERLDGTGYPAALTGGEIAIAARVVAAADFIDGALAAGATGSSVDAALDALARGAGIAFDLDCVGALLRRRAALHALYAGVRPPPLEGEVAAERDEARLATA